MKLKKLQEILSKLKLCDRNNKKGTSQICTATNSLVERQALPYSINNQILFTFNIDIPLTRLLHEQRCMNTWNNSTLSNYHLYFVLDVVIKNCNIQKQNCNIQKTYI
jgi:hypothetical protein